MRSLLFIALSAQAAAFAPAMVGHTAATALRAAVSMKELPKSSPLPRSTSSPMQNTEQKKLKWPYGARVCAARGTRQCVRSDREPPIVF